MEPHLETETSKSILLDRVKTALLAEAGTAADVRVAAIAVAVAVEAAAVVEVGRADIKFLTT
jgi:hypothetical protein